MPKIYGDQLEVDNNHTIVEGPADEVELAKRIAFKTATAKRDREGQSKGQKVSSQRCEVLSLWRRRCHRQNTGVFLVQVPRWTRPWGHVWDRWPACLSPRVVIGPATSLFHALRATTLLAVAVPASTFGGAEPMARQERKPPEMRQLAAD